MTTKASLRRREPIPDVHGRAALLLGESMVHALVEAKVLTVGEAIAIVDTAAEVKVKVAEAAGESRGDGTFAQPTEAFFAGGHFRTTFGR